jgi:hypothetical protein
MANIKLLPIRGVPAQTGDVLPVMKMARMAVANTLPFTDYIRQPALEKKDRNEATRR